MDLGGTKILVGEVDPSGGIVRSKKFNSDVSNQRNALKAVITAIEDYLSEETLDRSMIRSIGVGVVGRVDHRKGIWYEIDPERSECIEIGKTLMDRYNLPCVVDNDVRCGVAAENKLGWGRKSSNYIYVNIGTGIAAGTVAGGRLIRGASFNAGEAGHHVVQRDSDVLCCCGRIGCVEAIASGSGLDVRARMLADRYPETRLYFPKTVKCDTEEIFRLSDEGDPLCTRLAEDAINALANLIMNLVRFSDPDTVVLGGGVASSGWLLKKVNERLDKKTMRYVRNGVVLTGLDPDFIGLIGAGLNGIAKIENREEI